MPRGAATDHHSPITNHPPPSLPADARRSLAIYNLLFLPAFLALLPGYLLRMLRRGGYREKFGQRFGRFSDEDRALLGVGGWTWVHSISVGETLLALKLAREIRALDPTRRVVLSVTTSTGHAVAQPAACDWLAVIYNPLDRRAIVRRTLDLLRPRQLIFIEAIWPNLLAEAKRRGIATGFVPRLSPRSERGFRRFVPITGPIFRLLDRLAVQEDADVARWQSLGVEGGRITVTGNSKYDHASAPAPRVEEFRALLRDSGIPGTAPVLLGGSTFPGEERILAQVLRDLRADFPELLLILVPRHVERTPEILAALAPSGFRVHLRTDPPSSIQHPATSIEHPAPDILLVNTTGELRDWYHLATVVFIGKSLTATGGQNPVEAVVAGKPVVFGPHMENFAALTREWLAADAAVQVEDAATLTREVRHLLADPSRRAALVERSTSVIARHRGATGRTAGLFLKPNPAGQ